MASDDYVARARARAKQRRTSSWFKLSEGDNTFRILPTPASKTTPSVFYEYRMHNDVGPRKVRVMCGHDISDEGSCWLCDVTIPKLRKQGKETRASLLEAKDVTVIQVAKVTEDGDMIGPLLWNPSRKTGDIIISSILGSKKRKYADPKKGYNLTMDRVGTGRNDTRYGIPVPDEDPSEVPEDMVSKLKPFSELKEIAAYDEAKQKAAYTGQDVIADEEEAETESEDEDDVDVDDEEDDEPEPPKKGKVKAKPAKKAPEPEEEEEDGEEDDEEEEESAPPPKKKGAKASKPAPEEEEDEDDVDLGDDEEDDVDVDDEEDDEPEPPKKAPAKPGKAPVKAPPKKK